MSWKLVARRDAVLVLGTHLYFEVLNDNNERVWHIHGLATDENGVPQPVGNLNPFVPATDTIEIWTYPKNNSFEDNDGGHTLYTGTQEQITSALKDITAAKNFINAQNLIYLVNPGETIEGGFGGDRFNSNSIFNTLLNHYRLSSVG